MPTWVSAERAFDVHESPGYLWAFDIVVDVVVSQKLERVKSHVAILLLV